MNEDYETANIKAVMLYALRSFEKGVDRLTLYRILYFAQQNHIVTYGKVIFKDPFRVTDYGPTPTFIHKELQKGKGKSLKENLNSFLSGVTFENNKIYSSVPPDMKYISGSNKICLDEAIAKYKDYDPYDTSDLEQDKAWVESYKRMQDDPEKDLITIIDMARGGGADEEFVDYLREKQIFRKAFS